MLKPLRVRWAIDPFSDDLKSWRRVVDISKILSKKYKITIVPTYILSKDISGFFGNYVRRDTEFCRQGRLAVYR